MVVKDIFIEEGLFFFLDEILNKIVRNNISYVMIKNSDYIELHFGEFIYRFYFKEKNVSDKYVDYDEIYSDIGNITNNSYLIDNTNLACIVYNNPAIKRYTKNDIKYDNKNSNGKIKAVRSKVKAVKHKIT